MSNNFVRGIILKLFRVLIISETTSTKWSWDHSKIRHTLWMMEQFWYKSNLKSHLGSGMYFNIWFETEIISGDWSFLRLNEETYTAFIELTRRNCGVDFLKAFGAGKVDVQVLGRFASNSCELAFWSICLNPSRCSWFRRIIFTCV